MRAHVFQIPDTSGTRPLREVLSQCDALPDEQDRIPSGRSENHRPVQWVPVVTRGTGTRDVRRGSECADLKVQFKDSQLSASRQTAHTAL